jgi:hypothetical protein
MLGNDGDVIRGLGFVTLYAAYLEEAIDQCVELLLSTGPNPDNRILRRQASEKLRYCKRRLDELAPLPDELLRFPEVLIGVRELLERRHEYVHGRIYAQYGAEDQLRSGRRGVPDRPITSAELYDLANETSIVIYRFCGGRIAESWAEVDFSAVWQQLKQRLPGPRR